LRSVCILHTYVIYPLLLVALTRLARPGAWGYWAETSAGGRPAQLGLPNVSVLIAALQRAGLHRRRIENLLEQTTRRTS